MSMRDAEQGVFQGPELVFGLVGAVGTNLPLLTELLQSVLSAHAYESDEIRLSTLIDQIDPKSLSDDHLDKHVGNMMDGGDRLRKRLGSGDAVALLGLGAVRRARRRSSGRPNKPAQRRAYILRSLKHPAEVELLRSVYGSRLFIVAAYSARGTRVKQLAADIAASYQSPLSSGYLDRAEALATRDEAEEDREFGQRVRDTFPLADVFVDATDPQELERSLERFIEGIFGFPFHTPTREEYGMFHARAAALRSADLSRQVGAAVCTAEGDIVSVGCNEVPKAGGGLYWEDGEPDARDFRLGEDKNHAMKRLATGEVLDRLKKKGWLSPRKEKASLRQFETLMEGTRIDSLIEFGRAVHAEMAALTDAARRGVSVRGCDLYTTTFPCHGCAKHIVAAGIAHVIYVEPYPKSLADELHSDAISIDPSVPPANLVAFRPFVGVAPSAYLSFFARQGRKDPVTGKAKRFEAALSVPALADPDPTYVEREKGKLKVLSDFLDNE
jgi:deoxycytidylate deaminase